MMSNKPSCRPARRGSLFLGILLLLGLWACNVSDGTGKTYLDIKVDTSWVGMDSIYVVIQDTNGTPIDTLFHLKAVTGTSDLRKMRIENYGGEVIRIVIIGFKDEQPAKMELRIFNGIRTEDKRPIPVDPVNGALDIQPATLVLYKGGEARALTAYPLADWAGKAIVWTSENEAVARVSAAGVVTPVGQGSTRVKAAFGAASDVSTVQVMVDPPVIDVGGAETAVRPGEAASFTVTITQAYGVVAWFAWDYDGDGAPDDSLASIAVGQTAFTTKPQVFAVAGDFTLTFFARDGEGNEAKASKKLKVSDKVPRIDSISPEMVLTIKDEARLEAAVSVSGGGALAHRTWDFEDDGKVDDSAALSGSRATVSTRHAYPAAGVFHAVLRVVDDQGTAVSARVKVTVKQDAPTANAGSDQTVEVGGRVQLQGVANDSLGTVVKMEWKIGDGPFTQVSKADTAFAAPSSPQVIDAVFRVTDDDGQIVQDDVRITVQLTAVRGRLTGLALSDGTLAPGFSSATTDYTVAVSNSLGSMTVTPTAAPGDTIRVNAALVASGAPSQAIPLAVGGNQIRVEVTSPAAPMTTYNIAVTRAASASADLSALSLSAGALAPGFSPSRTEYTAGVGNATASVTVTATAADSGATVKVQNVLVASGQASAPVSLPAGSTDILIDVTSRDGAVTRRYKVAVTRAPSANAALSALVLSAGSLNRPFAPDTLTYAASVANGVASLTVTATAADAGATVRVEGAVTASGAASASIPLAVGTTEVNVDVTAQDGSTVRSYKVAVTRAPSANAALSSLAVSAGSLNQAFDPETPDYTVSVTNPVTSTTITPTAAAAGSAIKVDGVAVASGSPSGTISLPIGSREIPIEVTAPDGVTKRVYKVTITRAGSGNAQLSALTLSAGSFNEAFSGGITSYTLSVANNVASTTVTPTAADAGATIQVEGAAVASGQASGSIALPIGTKAINIDVTAQTGGTPRRYTVAITRAGSSNNNLSALALSAGSIAFSPATTSYSLSVANNVASTTVTPTAQDAGSTIQVDGTAVASGQASGSIALPIGSKTINIDVTAQAGGAARRYSVTVTRAASNDAALSNLAITQGTIVFSPSVFSYGPKVFDTVTSVRVTPTVRTSGATVTVNGSAVTSGNLSLPVSVTAAATTRITVVVTAPDGATKLTYIIDVKRPSWVSVGGAGFGTAADYVSLAMSGSTPYVAFPNSSNGSRLRVMSFGGSSWSLVGAADFTPAKAEFPRIVVSGTTPYVMYKDHGANFKPRVVSFSGAWNQVDSANVSTGVSELFPNIALNGTTPWIAFGDNGIGAKLVVKSLSGSTWSQVGAAGPSFPDFPELAFLSGTPYVAYRNQNSKAGVLTFNGNAWVQAGPLDLSEEIVNSVAIGMGGGAIHIVYENRTAFNVVIKKWNGSTWDVLNPGGSAPTNVNYTRLAFNGPIPHIAFRDCSLAGGCKMSVMKLSGNDWTYIGNPGFSASDVDGVSFALDGFTPYVAYVDKANGNRVTVMKYVDIP